MRHDQQWIYLPDHPIAITSGQVKYSRYVLCEKLGGQSAPCHVCGTMLHWLKKPLIVADHMDSNPRNNRPENLEPACRGCNANREDGTKALTTPIEHGTPRCYRNGCRRDECVEANRKYNREWRQKNIEKVRKRDREAARRRRAEG